MKKIIVRYAEIALKGSNRHIFIRQLKNNIIHILGIPPGAVKHRHHQFIVRVRDNETEHMLKKLKKVFGVAWFARTYSCPSTMEAIVQTGTEIALKTLDESKPFAIRAQRADKKLPFTSVEIEQQLGEAARTTCGARVDLNHPEITIFVTASTDNAFIYTEKIAGPGGLPVHTSGKVLSLLSGGLDSIAASFNMAKRGAEVDFLHFHVFPTHLPVLESPIAAIASNLATTTLSKYLYLASYTPFEMRMLDIDRSDARYELVVFRRLMARVAQGLAEKNGYQAIVLGDSLGQVASQTLENIVAVDDSVSIPIFRPLIGSDKKDIMRLVQQIGLFKEANMPYKDCCSLLSPHPSLETSIERVQQLEEKLNFEAIIAEILETIETVPISDLHFHVKTATSRQGS
ncbi:MAG: tRNA uracil 4-sulfurtransferase ThiI [Anaerolineales bacterium]